MSRRPQKTRLGDPEATGRIIAIGAMIMLAAYYLPSFLFPKTPQAPKTEISAPVAPNASVRDVAPAQLRPVARNIPAPTKPAQPALHIKPAPLRLETPKAVEKTVATPMDSPEIRDDIPQWRRNAVPVALKPGYAYVAVVIDDLGLDRARTAEAISLPAPLTLAFLPYAQKLYTQVQTARSNGHELLVHMPMEPDNASVDPGPLVLKTSSSEEQIDAILGQSLLAFSGYIGLNNHMGSHFTADPVAMDRLMKRMKDRELLFLDSKTTPNSAAEAAARKYGVPFLARDVFLDHEPGVAPAENALEHVEKVAHSRGMAIAIGHPKDATIAVLKEWLPTLEEKKIQLVPLSALAIAAPKKDAEATASSGPP